MDVGMLLTGNSRGSPISGSSVFGFVAEGYTSWRYELRDHDGATSVTESFSHKPHEGWQKFVYDTVARRSTAMVKGMQQTLTRMKETLEH